MYRKVLPNTKHVNHIQFSSCNTDRSVSKTSNEEISALFGFIYDELATGKDFRDFFEE